jgi:ABC-type glycerol-3-phosphate transport system permease component
MGAGTLVVVYALITILPLLWIIATSFKSPSDAIAYPPKTVFQPTLEGYVNLFTTRTVRRNRTSRNSASRRPGMIASCARMVS